MDLRLALTVILAACAFVSSFLVPTRGLGDRARRWLWVLRALILVCAVSIGVVGQRERAVQRHLEAGAGVVGAETRTDDHFCVSFGTNLMSDGDFGLALRDPVKLRQNSGGRLLVSYELRDASGQIIARIRDNEWFDLAEGYDRNFSDELFEVVDTEKNQAVLQIRRRGNAVAILGRFWDPGGTPLWVTSEGFVHPPPSDCLRPWFRYPSELHPGELTEDAQLPELPTFEQVQRVLDLAEASN